MFSFCIFVKKGKLCEYVDSQFWRLEQTTPRYDCNGCLTNFRSGPRYISKTIQTFFLFCQLLFYCFKFCCSCYFFRFVCQNCESLENQRRCRKNSPCLVQYCEKVHDISVYIFCSSTQTKCFQLFCV